MKVIKRDEDCDPDLSDAECCDMFIKNAHEDIKYYSNESKYALKSPEWEGEYEAYQDHINGLYREISVCKNVKKWSKELGVVSINHISEEDWAEYQMEQGIRRMEEYAERDYL